MDLNIKGLRVIVTAGANGIGLAIARAFAGEGARVHVCDVDQAALAALTASDPTITQTHCDVADRPSVQRLFDEATAKLGGLDVLVNNAGVAGPTAKVEEMHPDDWDRCLNICLTGQFNCTRLAVPLLRQSSNGSIVNLSSTTFASTRSCPASSPAIASAACWKPRRSSAAFPLRRWRKQRSPIRQSRTMSHRNRSPTRSCSWPAHADVRSRARLFRSAATPKC
jgi:NAD(P)-dependent dehydrogenase (short-subunit alcohol dehydrogenase family)